MYTRLVVSCPRTWYTPANSPNIYSIQFKLTHSSNLEPGPELYAISLLRYPYFCAKEPHPEKGYLCGFPPIRFGWLGYSVESSPLSLAQNFLLIINSSALNSRTYIPDGTVEYIPIDVAGSFRREAVFPKRGPLQRDRPLFVRPHFCTRLAWVRLFVPEAYQHCCSNFQQAPLAGCC